MTLMVKCPVCRSKVSWEGNPHRPFCSERCRLIDLGAWAEGKYRIPGKKLNQEPDEKGENDDDEEPA